MVVGGGKLDLRARQVSELVLGLHAEIDRFVAAHRGCCPGPPRICLRGPAAIALGLGLRLAKDADVVFMAYHNVEKRYVAAGSAGTGEIPAWSARLTPAAGEGRDNGE